jgi:hypothetical protein
MTQPRAFAEAHVTGEQITNIIDSIADRIDAVPRSHAIVALLTLSTVLMCPMVTEEDLHESVKGMSQWLCFYLDGKYDQDDDGSDTPPVTLN